MFTLQSVTGRIVIGEIIGFIFGIIVILLLPTMGMEPFSMFGFGTLLLFILMGAMIGFVGQYDRHPAFDFKMSWWLRGPLIGVTFMLVLILLSYDNLEVIMQSTLISWTGLSSPFWALIDGLVIGTIMGYIETTIAGEGANLPLK